jgi:hypothetical protein
MVKNSMSLRLTTLPAFLIAATNSGIAQSGIVVRSASQPPAAFRVSEGFAALPPLAIALPSTDVDRRIFVDGGNSKSIRRLVIFQFERVRSGSKFKFVYAPKPSYDFGGTTYRIGTYVYDDAADAAAAPGFEAAVTRKTLVDRGYDPPRFLRVMRLARVADSEGQSEIIIFYAENADADYPGNLKGTDADGDLPLTGAEAQALIVRALSAITPLPPAQLQR